MQREDGTASAENPWDDPEQNMSDEEIQSTAGTDAPGDPGATDLESHLTSGGTDVTVGTDDDSGGGAPRGFGPETTTGGESSGTLGTSGTGIPPKSKDADKYEV